ncbi:elongation factor G [Thiorhodovibrio frisius]|uniref:Elongation factor G n=1 Tax=Thiorhodovibrio frisius TaxID=631362 RepID=H8YZ27_9GAMM|nr:elongation factor G [Thiorhodovibrio frisius]EIC21954.1 small GTP-binding protein domain protein [Thiorhodovibrio frisius]WPL24243.1 Elongation factor G [Thiorhodovibrio frisius]
MSDYNAEDVRNIALVGHAGSGKTSLVEALLVATKSIPEAGSIARGNTVCDHDPMERELQHSLDVAITAFNAHGKHVNLIDTPGFPDFLGRSLSVLSAVETAAIVINADSGIEPVTQRMWKGADRRNLCRMIVINKIDAPGVDLAAVTAQVRETFGAECLPINLPAEGGKRVVDCFFQPAGGETDFSSVEEAHSTIVDQVVEVDEKLMEVYLEQGQELKPEQLHDPFEEALREAHLIPICYCSAETGAGIPELITILERLMPNPAEGNPPPFIKGEGAERKPVQVSPDLSQHAIAHVFKVVNDPFRGKLGIFRIHQGRIVPNSQLLIGDARKPFKVNHLFRLHGNELVEVDEGVPGDILAVARVDDIHFDAVLHDSHDEDHFHLDSIECPVPLFGLAISPTKRGDEQKLTDALHKLEDEDPCFHVEHNAAANETVMRGLGELHLKVLMRRLSEQFHVEVETRPPKIPYRETITGKAEGHHRHKKQTGGAGQFGEVFLRVEPLEQGGGFDFVDATVGGSIPGQFIPSIEKGVRQVLEEGAVAGYPMQDVRVTVYDGKFHPVDSKDIAFATAGRKAFIEAVEKAKPVVMEPVVKIRIVAQDSAMGDLAGDLSSRRGRINGSETKTLGRVAIDGEVPLAELDSYESRLKSLTGGEGTYGIELSHYAPVPGNVQKQLSDAFQRAED